MIFESMTLRSITTCPVPGNVLPFPGSTDLGLGLDLAILQVSRVGRDVGAAGMLEWGWGDHGEQILYIQRDTILLQDGNFSRQQPGIADKGLWCGSLPGRPFTLTWQHFRGQVTQVPLRWGRRHHTSAQDIFNYMSYAKPSAPQAFWHGRIHENRSFLITLWYFCAYPFQQWQSGFQCTLWTAKWKAVPRKSTSS